MSANICWLPTDPRKSKSIDVGAPSAFMEAMERAGLRLPCTIAPTDLAMIEGMAALFGPPSRDRPNPYRQIADAVAEHGSIEIWAEY